MRVEAGRGRSAVDAVMLASGGRSVRIEWSDGVESCQLALVGSWSARQSLVAAVVARSFQRSGRSAPVNVRCAACDSPSSFVAGSQKRAGPARSGRDPAAPLFRRGRSASLAVAESTRRLTAHKAVAFFAGELDALPLPDGTVVCPDDDGSQVVATLTYPQSRSVAVSVGLRGCETATNGTVSRTASGFGSPPEQSSSVGRRA